MPGPHHSIAAAVLVRAGRVLLGHRHLERRWYPDVWDLPGGHVENGESPAEAVRRELFEELGVHAEIDDPVPYRTFEIHGELTLHVWVVTKWKGDVINMAPDEHDDLGWFGREDVAGLQIADEALRPLLVDATVSTIGH